MVIPLFEKYSTPSQGDRGVRYGARMQASHVSLIQCVPDKFNKVIHMALGIVE